jgi:hypothetical protein
MKRLAMNEDRFWSVLFFVVEGTDLKLSFSLRDVSREVSTIIFVDVSVSAGAVNAVMTLFGGDFDVVRFHIEINFMGGSVL